MNRLDIPSEFAKLHVRILTYLEIEYASIVAITAVRYLCEYTNRPARCHSSDLSPEWFPVYIVAALQHVHL